MIMQVVKLNLANKISRSRTLLRACSTHAATLSKRNHTIEIPRESFQIHKLDVGPSNKIEVESEELLVWLEQMMRIRRMETSIGDLYKNRFIRGFCHLYSGQEAVGVGIEAACQPQDSIITSYRCHGLAYLRGTEPKYIIAELLGRSDGSSKGKGGSMHLYGKNFFGGNGIVGAQVPIGAGIALAHKYKEDGGVCFAIYGDGASNQGQLFEAYNMAQLWNLPCVFTCENNRYGMGTSQERSSASFQYYTRGDFVPGLQVDGMDILAMKQAAEYCADYARKRGPILLEAVCYRYGGHSMSDPGTSYRTRDEVKKMKSKQDPIMMLRQRVIELGITTESEIDALQKSLKKEIDEAVIFAKASPEPAVDTLCKDIFVKPLEKVVRGCDNFSYTEI